MRSNSLKILDEVHPVLKNIILQIDEQLKEIGINIEIVSGLRTFKEQDELYAQGRTIDGPIVTRARGGSSNHNYGLAVDVCPFIDNKPNWNAKLETWLTIGNLAETYGLEWGGNWEKFVDKPHIQLPLDIRKCQRYYDIGGLQAVWETASNEIQRT